MTDARNYLHLLGQGRGAARLENAGAAPGTPPPKPELLDRLQAEIAWVEKKTGVPADADAKRALLGNANEALSRLYGDGGDASLGETELSGLEAVVRADGSRPVLFVEDDFVDLRAPSLGLFAAQLSRVSDAVRDVCRSVGRVDDPSPEATLGYQGTAWVVGDGLVATNFHVLQAIAPGGVRADGRFQGRLKTGVSVHFGHEVGGPLPERRFPIRRVVAVGREGGAGTRHPDFPDLNFGGLDLAILELEPVPGRPFPAPVRVARGDDPVSRGGLATRGRGVYLVGYPGGSTSPDLFASIFAGVRSFKRLAPGAIMASAGEVAHDPKGWVLTHDISTLGGNSGSALVDLDGDGRSVLGLHFAGNHLRENWAHAAERITADLDAALGV
ncbi:MULTISPECIES: trypsin-like serine peptidase [unclassified Saccharothrix]|uniref:trypsin-like serine peptidase n=1 Tax=unclassified Saccharothrix TaxID=2593673 RepID=UPI00307EE666